jgi:hypothetical protein
MAIFTHSRSDYERFLRERLPEYTLVGDVPAPGQGAQSAITFELANPSLAKFGASGHRPVVIPEQPRRLVITGSAEGKKRLDDLKHFVNKRNKIIEVLAGSAEASAKGLHLKVYDRWDRFMVGRQGTTDDDVDYEHLAVLREDLAKLTDPTTRDLFRLRRFFHRTTPEQKEQMVRNLLAEHRMPAFRLVEFRDKNCFFIEPENDGYRASVGRLEFNSYSDLHERLTGYRGGVEGFATELGHSIARRLNRGEHERKLAEEIIQIRAKVPEDMQIYVQVDTLQKKLVTAYETILENERSLVHKAYLAIKAAVVGKHVRTHPFRTLRILTGHLLKGVSAVVGEVQKMNLDEPPPTPTLAEEMLEQAKSTMSDFGGKSAELIMREVVPPKVPQWAQDLGWGTTEMEQDKRAWTHIQEHLNSMEKWEGDLKSSLGAIATGIGKSVSQRPSCKDVDTVLYQQAKMLYHLVGVKTLFKAQVEHFDGMVEDLEAARTQLESHEGRMKGLIIEFESRTNAAYELIKGVDLAHYSLVRQLRTEGMEVDERMKRTTAPPSRMDVAMDFIDDPENA